MQELESPFKSLQTSKNLKPFQILTDKKCFKLPTWRTYSPKATFLLPSSYSCSIGFFINQNCVANFSNLIHFGSITFSLVILVFHHQLGQSFMLFYVYPLVFLNFIFLYFFIFLFFLWCKKWVTTLWNIG